MYLLEVGLRHSLIVLVLSQVLIIVIEVLEVVLASHLAMIGQMEVLLARLEIFISEVLLAEILIGDVEIDTFHLRKIIAFIYLRKVVYGVVSHSLHVVALQSK